MVYNCIKFVGKYINLANLSNTKRYTFLAVKVYLFCAPKKWKINKIFILLNYHNNIFRHLFLDEPHRRGEFKTDINVATHDDIYK